jgi:hypothetical protein
MAWGDVDQIAQRVRQHVAAGADHVAVQAITEDPARQALPLLHRLAALA